MSPSFHKSPSPLALHVDLSGGVWSARTGQGARRTRLGAAQFTNGAVLTGVVRVLGSPENTELICRLWSRRRAGEDFALELATPRLGLHCTDVAQLVCEVAASVRFPASLGGWHELTDAEYVAYQLAWLGQRGELDLETAQELLLEHPAYARARFIRTLDLLAFAQWLGEVRDPRWYVAVDKPDRTSTFEQYLGLWPKNQAAVTMAPSGQLPRGSVAYRCELTRKCWLPDRETEMDRLNLEDPRNFLLRSFRRRYTDCPVRATVRSSQLFARYVRAAWVDGLLIQSGTATCDPLFDPAEFLFRDELAAFAEFYGNSVP